MTFPATRVHSTHMEITAMVILNSGPVVVGAVVRMPVPGAGMRVAIAGIRLRLSAGGSRRSRFKFFRLIGHKLYSGPVVIGAMIQMPVHSAGMRITIAGIRIRISAGSSQQI